MEAIVLYCLGGWGTHLFIEWCHHHRGVELTKEKNWLALIWSLIWPLFWFVSMGMILSNLTRGGE